MKKPDVKGAVAYALGRLAAELPPHVTYHSLSHTRDEVLPAAVELARLARLPARETDLLRVGAAFHDLGYVERPEDHEICSARIAAQALPALAFDSRAIEQVMSLVLVTRMPQSPRNLLEELICDADLSSLGADNFLTRSAALLQERRAFGQELDEEAWWEDQSDFLTRHHYWTQMARNLRTPGKERNLLQLQQLLADSRSDRPCRERSE